MTGTDSCVGEEKACLRSECGFSSPCHVKAFRLRVHIILCLIVNAQEKETRDESEYKTQLLHCHFKKAIQWPLLCPWSWDHIVSDFQGEIALICVNIGLKGWVFFSNLSLSLPPSPCPASWGQEQVYLAFRENSTDYLKNSQQSPGEDIEQEMTFKLGIE